MYMEPFAELQRRSRNSQNVIRS